MSTTTVLYNVEGEWVEVSIDCIEAFTADLPFTIMCNNRVKGVNHD
jgi:hypothetical protein